MKCWYYCDENQDAHKVPPVFFMHSCVSGNTFYIWCGTNFKKDFFNIYPCWGTSQISKQYNNLNYHSFGSNASWCLRVRCLIGCLNKCCRLGFKIYFWCSSLGPKKTRAVRMSQSWSNSYIQCDAFITWSILQNSHNIHAYMYQKTRPS